MHDTPPIENAVTMDAVTVPDSHDTVVVERRAAPVTEAGPRDGSIKGPAIFSDGHCPLLVDDADIDNRAVVEELTNADGSPGGQLVHRYGQQRLTDPVECPTCFKKVERHALVNQLVGERDCAIAIASRANPRYGRAYKALDDGDDNLAAMEAGRLGPFGNRFIKVFLSTREKGDDAMIEPTDTSTTEKSFEAQVHDEWIAAGRPAMDQADFDAKVAAKRATAAGAEHADEDAVPQQVGQYTIGADGTILRDGQPIPEAERAAYDEAYAKRAKALGESPEPAAQSQTEVVAAKSGPAGELGA